jgi:hypothetical protein
VLEGAQAVEDETLAGAQRLVEEKAMPPETVGPAL